MSLRRIIILIVAGGAALGAILWFGRHPAAPLPVPADHPVAHVYNSPDKPITDIKLLVFYAIPANKKGAIAPGWQDSLKKSLDESVAFHKLQLRGLSSISYEIYPEPLMLQYDDVFYDTTSTSGGNSHGLINVAEEIDRRVLSPGGDLYSASFASGSASEYRVLGIVYEGVGASGGLIYDSSLSSVGEIAKSLGVPESMIYIVSIDSVGAFFLMNRAYLTESPLSSYGASILYHEFAHTIGLPDTFDKDSGPTTNDIMGTGRYRPIQSTYLDRQFLKGMGILQ